MNTDVPTFTTNFRVFWKMHNCSVTKIILPSENLSIRKQVVLDLDIKQTLMEQPDLNMHIKGWLVMSMLWVELLQGQNNLNKGAFTFALYAKCRYKRFRGSEER